MHVCTNNMLSYKNELSFYIHCRALNVHFKTHITCDDFVLFLRETEYFVALFTTFAI